MRGVRSVLDRSRVFDWYQYVVGAERAKRWFVESHCLPRQPRRLLEVGCGTGALCKYLPTSCAYLGVDIDERYVSSARRQFPDRVFAVADIGDEYTFRQIAGQYDLVVAFGVLHHLDNKQVLQGLTGARAVLGEQGAFLAAEPCWYSDEKPIERLMKRFDRGGFIRDADGYMQLVSSVFQSAVVSLEVGQMAMQYGLAVITGAQ